MEPILQPPESVRQPLRVLGACMVTGAILAAWKLHPADVIACGCVVIAGASLVRVPWDYRFSGPGLGGWALLLLSCLFAFVFDGTPAKVMMLLLTATGAGLTGVAPRSDADEDPVDS